MNRPSIGVSTGSLQMAVSPWRVPLLTLRWYERNEKWTAAEFRI